MYIKSYQSKRFAGLRDMELEFEKGLNVILGENESGKSTIVDGMQAALFKNIRLKKNNNADIDFIFRYMPKPSGDFIDSSITIKNDNGKHRIHRQWGSSEAIEYTDSDGNIFKDEKEINNELLNLLGYGESTYSNIVFAKQEDLKSALSKILKNRDVTDEVSDILRRTMMELDGVSLDKLEKDIEEEIDNLYKRWDREKNYPQNNRGVHNQYVQGLGEIVKSYYKKEELSLQLEEIQKNEKEFEEVCEKIKKLERDITPLEEKKKELEAVEDDINDRAVVEVKVSSLEESMEDLLDANKNWPMIENSLDEYHKKIDELKGEKEECQEEKTNIEKNRKKEKLEAKLNKLQENSKKLEEVKKKKESIPEINEESIDKLRELENEINTVKASMEAGKILGKLKSSSQPVYITRNLGDAKELRQEESFEADGFINIKSGDNFEIEIKTGEVDFEELSNRHNSLSKQYKELLEDLNLDSIEDGLVNLQKLRELNEESKGLEKEKEFYLDGESLEDIKREMEELKDVKVTSSLEEIEARLEEISKEEVNLLSKRNSEREKVDNWKEKYESHDKLLDIIIDKKSDLKLEEKKLSKLEPLPEEFETAEEFKASLRDTKGRLDKYKEELETTRPLYYDAKNKLPETSYEEVKKQQVEARKKFESNLRRGSKLLKIKNVFLNTKEKLSSDPMKTLVDEFLRLLETITDGDYRQADIDEDFNIKLENRNGEIPVELLSAGTYDSVVLALRFALLKHIFQEEDGYVVLDDCLVDLDPTRKKESIKLINEFAKNYQIIFTTCDPETASQLGGNIIEI